MTIATFADAVVARLRRHGVRRVFGIPGTHNLELFRAIAEQGMELLPAHHEQGLGYAADALARVTGEPAVVVTTTGPGITNLVTALATSAAASVPVLAIAPGIPESGVGRGEGWLHDLPSQEGLLGQLVRSRRALSSADAIAFIDSVVRSWREERPLPAYLEIPFDLLGEPAAESADALDPALAQPDAQPDPLLVPAAAEIGRAAAFLLGASSPAIVVGRGASPPAAAAEIRVLAESLGAPVLTTANGKGVLDERHPLALGVSLRLSAGKRLLDEADAVLVVGTDLGRSEFWGPCPLDGAKTVRVDVDERSMTANLRPAFPLLGRAEAVLPLLSVGLSEHAVARRPGREAEIEGWAAGIRDENLADGGVYRAFHEHIQEATDSREIAITGDSSQASYFGTASFWRAPRANRFLYPAGYGTLGYAVPAAVGAYASGELEAVIAVTGEGGLLFSIQELATAAELAVPVTVVAFVNGGYKEIRDGMVEAGIPRLGVGFRAPDLVSIARGFHMGAERVVADGAGEAAFRDALDRALASGGATLIEVDIAALGG